MKRRDAIKTIGATIAGAIATGLPVNAHASEESANTIDFKLPDPSPNEDILLTMQRDLLRALRKPVNERSFSMTIDLRKCFGCNACTVGCISENKLPPNVVYRPVYEEEEGNYPAVTIKFLPRPCMHCDNPPCLEVCPVEATWKREDGIVVIDYKKCIGCKKCIGACPYSARSFDAGNYYTENTPAIQEYEKTSAYEYGIKWERKTAQDLPAGKARKCHFCIQRIGEGLLPMCVTTCVGRATYFGDMSDPEALISKVTIKPRTWKYKEEYKTKPSVTYLI